MVDAMGGHTRHGRQRSLDPLHQHNRPRLRRPTRATDRSGTKSVSQSAPPSSHSTSNTHSFVTEYYIEGHRLVHGNVILFLHRVLHEPGVRSVEEAPKTSLPPFDSLQLLDLSGAYILEAKVCVQDFRGCVELALPERLALDTRVKYKPPVAAVVVGGQNRPR
jgi:mediator of RNA polymerase II transcription subunit 18